MPEETDEASKEDDMFKYCKQCSWPQESWRHSVEHPVVKVQPEAHEFVPGGVAPYPSTAPLTFSVWRDVALVAIFALPLLTVIALIEAVHP